MRANRWLFLLLLIAIVFSVLLPAGSAFAADDAAPKGGGTTVMDTIKAGGVIGFIIIGLSVLALTWIIVSAMALRRDQLVPPEILGQVEAYFDDEEYEEAMALCETNPNYLTNVIAAGLPKISFGWEHVKTAMDEIGTIEAAKLHTQISYLSLIASVAPMLGLLGTVMGMIGAFNSIVAAGGQADAVQLAGGISMALVTTCLGLIVAIPAQIGFFVLRNIVAKTVIEVSAITEELMERFMAVE